MSAYKILLWRLHAVFSYHEQELDMGCQRFDMSISVLKLQGVFLAVVLWQHPTLAGQISLLPALRVAQTGSRVRMKQVGFGKLV